MNLVGRVKNKSRQLYTNIRGKDDISKNLQKFSTHKPIVPVIQHKDFEKRIEIIIPCYNHAMYLRQAYDSVLSQTWKKFPITLTFIDDNSTDETWAKVGELAKDKSEFINFRRIRNKQNLRQWASINKAVETSNNDLFIILNDDDALVPDCLEKIIYAFKKNPNLLMVGGSSIWFNNKLPRHSMKPLEKVGIKIYTPEHTKSFTQLNDLNMTHSSEAFFKQAWQAVGGYFPKEKRIHTMANEDRDFQMRINSLFDVGVYNYPLAYWRTDSSHGKNY